MSGLIRRENGKLLSINTDTSNNTTVLVPFKGAISYLPQSYLFSNYYTPDPFWTPDTIETETGIPYYFHTLLSSPDTTLSARDTSQNYILYQDSNTNIIGIDYHGVTYYHDLESTIPSIQSVLFHIIKYPLAHNSYLLLTQDLSNNLVIQKLTSNFSTQEYWKGLPTSASIEAKIHYKYPYTWLTTLSQQKLKIYGIDEKADNTVLDNWDSTPTINIPINYTLVDLTTVENYVDPSTNPYQNDKLLYIYVAITKNFPPAVTIVYRLAMSGSSNNIVQSYVYSDFVINSFLHIDNNRIVALGYKGDEAVFQPIGESSEITNTLTSWTVGLPYHRNDLSYGARYYLKTGRSSQNIRFKWLDSDGNLDLYVKDNTNGYSDIPSDTQVQSVLLDVDGKLVVGFKNRTIKRFLGDYQLPIPPLSTYDQTLTPLSRDLFWHWDPREILGSRDLSNSEFSVDVSIPGPDDTFYVCGRRLGVSPYVWWIVVLIIILEYSLVVIILESLIYRIIPQAHQFLDL